MSDDKTPVRTGSGTQPARKRSDAAAIDAFVRQARALATPAAGTEVVREAARELRHDVA